MIDKLLIERLEDIIFAIHNQFYSDYNTVHDVLKIGSIWIIRNMEFENQMLPNWLIANNIFFLLGVQWQPLFSDTQPSPGWFLERDHWSERGREAHLDQLAWRDSCLLKSSSLSSFQSLPDSNALLLLVFAERKEYFAIRSHNGPKTWKNIPSLRKTFS